MSLNNLELTQLLLRGGADVYQSSQGQSMVQIAEAEGNLAMLDLLQKAQQ